MSPGFDNSISRLIVGEIYLSQLCILFRIFLRIIEVVMVTLELEGSIFMITLSTAVV